jgi:lipopolysaccharide transport system ATP-binding protein
MPPIIDIQDLGKKYKIGSQQGGYLSLRDELVRFGARLRHPFHRSSEYFWALKHVSMIVQAGEAVGIIGRNGAGKSTLLKVLSQITPPTEGRITCRGRVASLLEVGTGFHPELTGRENIFLNGTILGMTRKEIRQRFDEIVAFSEVERFLDTPVKRYSSGMHVRLAFAVAAHLTSEILVVDEVLAVGDAEFQRKCLRKMGEVAHAGRTVLFVSHNMAAIQRLCNSGIYLNQGAIAYAGSTTAAIDCYQKHRDDSSSVPLGERPDRDGDGRARLESLMLNGEEVVDVAHALSGDRLRFDMRYTVAEVVPSPVFFLTVWDSTGLQLLHFNSRLNGVTFKCAEAQGVVVCEIPHLPLPAGDYRINVAIQSDGSLVDRVETALRLHVEASSYYGTGYSFYGKCFVEHEWYTSECEPASACAAR